MPVFDWENATVSTDGFNELIENEHMLPFIYGDTYPNPNRSPKYFINTPSNLSRYFSDTADYDNPLNSSFTSLYNQSINCEGLTGTPSAANGFVGRIPYDYRRHILSGNGTLTFGIGQTAASFFKPGASDSSQSQWSYSEVGPNAEFMDQSQFDNDGKSVSEHLFDILHNPDFGVSVKLNGTWYNIYFPIEFDDDMVANKTGGQYVDTSLSGSVDDGLGNTGAAVNDYLNIKYTGTHPSGHNGINRDGIQLTACRPSQDIMKALARTALDFKYGPNFKNYVNNKYTDFEEQFPYVTSYAQVHFDIMCDLAWHKGEWGAANSFFIYQYAESTIDGSSVSGASDLEQYKDAAKAIMFMGLMPDTDNEHKNGVYDANGVLRPRYIWKNGLVNRRLKNINQILGGTLNKTSASSDSSFSVYPDPRVNPAWYDGPEIPKDFQFAPDEFYAGYFKGIGGFTGFQQTKYGIAGKGGGGQAMVPSNTNPGSIPNVDQLDEGATTQTTTIDDLIAESTKLPTWDFWTGTGSAGALANIPADYHEYYTGQRSIYDTEPGSETFYAEDVYYQSAYSKWWQDGTSWFHGATASSSPRAATKHGAVLASTQYATLPSYMIGLNEDGGGESKVYIRSSVSQSLVFNGLATDDCYDIANGKSLGTIDYGQWNHFAITREGDNFYTFKNGVKQDSWQSARSIKMAQPDTKTWAVSGLNLSIGRSQISDFFYGYIDGLRITKGTAKHTVDSSTGDVTYTVPTSAPTVETAQTNYTGIHYIETVLSALNKIATQLDIEWKLRIGTSADDATRTITYQTNEGKLLLDAGPRTDLFVGHGLNDNANAVVVRGTSGEDPSIVGLDPSSIKSEFDAREYVSTVEYLVTAADSTADTLDVTDTNIPYRDLNGNPLERVIYASEPDHPHISKEERARAFLNELKKVKRTINLDLDYYDIQGDFEVGDMIFVYDPDLGFEDNESKRVEDGRTALFEVAYQGEYINPEKIRVTSITWPIKSGYGVYLRRLVSPSSHLTQYIDISPYVQWEEGGARLEVGDAPVKLGDDLRFSPAVTGITTTKKAQRVAAVRDPDNSATNGINLVSGFIEDALGVQQAIIKVTWMSSLNEDGSIVQNGSHYNIRFKKTGSTDPYTELSVEWGNEEFTIEGLAIATNYEVGVQAVNSNGYLSAFTTDYITTAVDSDAPKKPGPATTIAPGALRVQIIHDLGAAVDDNGNPVSSVVNYTLELDIDHINVYYSQTSGFSISGMTPKGQIPVTASHIRNQIPAIGEVQIANGENYYWRFTVVDKAGNESDPSDEQTAQGNLVETQNIGTAAITEAKIRDLAVTTAKIVDAAITNAKIGDTIESDNYSEGSQGWTIKKQKSGYPNGYAEFNDAIFRGNITATTGAIGGWDIASDTLKADYTTGGTTYYLTLDATNGTIEGNFATGSTGWQIAADGSVEFNDGNFRGDITGSTGTFSGGINIGNGTFVVNSQGGVTLNSITGFHITP